MNEETLLNDIVDAENAIKKTLEDLSKKYQAYAFCMASTEYKHEQIGGDSDTFFMIDISCYLKRQ